MDLAFLYSVYWNLFNVSLVWTDSHAPLEGGPGTQSSNKLVGGWAQDAVWPTRQVSRRRGVEAKQDLDHNPLSSSRPLFSFFPNFASSSFLPLFLFFPLFPLPHQLPPSSSLVFVQNTLYVLSI